MNRRAFGRCCAALAAAMAANAQAAERRVASLVKPPRLRRGDVVGLIAPGGVVDDALVQKCFVNLESLGFKVKAGAHLLAAHGGYAGRVEQRLADLHDMFAEREVRAIWAARGGSGCTALLPGIDYALARRHAKIVIGYSDITALHLALYRRAGIVTFHGPVASSTFSPYSVQRLVETLMEPTARVTFDLAPEQLEQAQAQPHLAPHVHRPGRAEGRLVGGNLSTLCALLGTPFAPQAGASLLFLEDVGEAPYRIDRMLTQLGQAGVLRQAAGVMLGVFRKSEATDGEPSLTLAQVLEERLGALRVPAVYGYSFGHVPQQMTLPLGVRARLDTEARSVTLLEAAVS